MIVAAEMTILEAASGTKAIDAAGTRGINDFMGFYPPKVGKIGQKGRPLAGRTWSMSGP